MKNVAVIGIGKLGLCFALTLEREGFNVVGVDISETYIRSINDRLNIVPSATINSIPW